MGRESLRFLMVSTHFPPSHLGGDAMFVEYLSRELIKRGHEVHVYYSPAAYELLRGKPASSGRPADDSIVRHEYKTRTGRLDPFLALSLGLWGRARRKLEEIVTTTKPDVVHWHNPRGFIGRPYAFPDAISLYTTHDYTAVCPRSNLMKPGMRVCDDPRWCTICNMRWGKPPHLWRAGSRRVLRLDDQLKVISPSEFMASRLRKDGIKVHRVLKGFVPDLGKSYSRGSSEDDTLVYLGLLEKHKGVESLLEAFAKSKDSQGFKLVFIGEGTMRTALSERAKREGLGERVTFPGFLSREAAENIRKGAVAQIVPSIWYENAPSTVLEAYSLGVPVLASSIGGLPEMVGPESGSYVFRPGDVGQLSNLLKEVWETRSMLSDRKAKARHTYETKFAPEIHVSEYLRTISAIDR